MNEKILHRIWQKKILPSTKLNLTNGQEIHILNFGTYNEAESGPDFFNATVKIDDVIYHGSIEIHVLSSDWHKHKHLVDRAYDNVILHVVWKHDLSIVQNDYLLPTLQLSDYVNESSFFESKKTSALDFSLPCSYQLSGISKSTIENQKEFALKKKWKARIQKENWFQRTDKPQVLYEMLASAFGTKVNELPFIQLSKKLPLAFVLNKSLSEKLALMALYSNVPEVVEESEKVKEHPLNPWEWKTKGLMPAGRPAKRIRQFALFVHHFPYWFELNRLTLDQLYQYSRNFKLSESNIRISDSMRNLLFLNAFVPFYYSNLKTKEDSKSFQEIKTCLSRLKSENNNQTRRMTQAGFCSENAYDSQALLELYRHFCKKKLCLTCQIGQETLRK